jgi:8-oxo-dGTP diphosphatase
MPAAIVDVAAAVILRADGAFLLARRPEGKVYAGWWEFPGGKVEAGEPASAALARELHEELGIDVDVAYPWITRVFAYEHATVRLHFFRVTAWHGEPHPRERQAIAWQRPGEPVLEPMLPANAPVLASLLLPAEYAITNGATTLAQVETRLREGLGLLRVREATADFAARASALAKSYGARALGATGAGLDGTHFTSRELLALQARPDGFCAASCHDRAELERAMALGLDFVVLGPVKPTATHPGAATLGWNGFSEIARDASIPVYAIGGLAPQDLHDARTAGAHGLAMIRGSWR